MQRTRMQQGAGPAGFDTAGRADEHDFAPAFIDTMSAGRHIRLTSSPPELHPRRRSAPPTLRLLALLLAVLGLFAAAPAAAQTTIWSTMLEVDVSGKYGRFGTYAGCDDAHDGQDDCIATLFDNDFRFDGTTYRVMALYYAGNSGSVSISFDKDIPSGILDGGVLVLGETETELAFADAEQTGKQAKWLNASFDWSDDQRIPVSLKVPTEGAPSGLVVTPGATQLDLQWTAPSGTVTGYHVHYTSSGSRFLDGDQRAPSGGTSSRGWADVGYSGGTTPSHTITGLTTGTVYRLRVRAVTASGAGPWAFATGTPTTPPPVGSQIPVWSATLTVDMDTRFVTLEWGCDDKQPVLDDCSAALTDNEFVFNGTTYTVKALYLLGNRLSGGGFTVWQVVLDFDKPTPTTTLTLHLDTAQLLTSNAQRMYSSREVGGRITGGDRNARWNWYRSARDGDSYYKRRGVSWTDGQQVSVKLTWAAKPRDLTVTPGNAKLDLSWRAPAGPAVTGYDVHYTSAPEVAVADGSTAFGSDASLAWVAATRAGATASQTIASLDNDTAYRVRVRARNGSGTGEWAFGRGTPTASQPQEQGGSSTSTEAVEVQPNSELIAQMREWRADPQWVWLKEHTDRWDRALLAFGETVSDGTLTAMTAAEAQGYADRGWERWVGVAEALRQLEAGGATGNEPAQEDPPAQPAQDPPPQPAQDPPTPLHATLLGQMYDWREDPQWRMYHSHTSRWDRALLAFGEPVSDTSLTPMTDARAQEWADSGLDRWVPVAAALKKVETGTSGADTLTGTGSGELLVGLGGADALNAQGGDDELRGGNGNDDLTGGAGRDRFVFFSGETGANTVTDFASGDVIVLKGSGWASVADIIAGVQAVGSTGYRYTLASGLTVETTNNRTLRAEEFLAE